jgi:hypothetical protein
MCIQFPVLTSTLSNATALPENVALTVPFVEPSITVEPLLKTHPT